MRYRAILFDLDGTLADTLQDIAAAANHALVQLGRPPIELPRYRYLAGQGLEYLIREALGPGREESVACGMELFRAFYGEHWRDHTRPYGGVPELLDALAARGVPMAVLSNKPDAATRAVVEHAFARWRFDAVRGQQPGGPLKPDPAGAIQIARDLAVPPPQWLYVGDTRVDMLTAAGAGMFAVGVLWGFRDEAELRASGAQAIIAEPAELLGLLD